MKLPGIALVLGMHFICASVASAADTTQLQTLSADAAVRLTDAASRFAKDRKLAVSIVIVDASGHFLSGVRMDGAPFATFDVARGKAIASAATGGVSGAELVKRYQANPIVFGQMSSLVYGGPVFPSQGSLGVYVEGRFVGAIGVSGGPSDADEEVGRRGLAAIGATEAP
ncbi:MULTISPECIES: GlcG/HbpS family heme-binding protein [unclassified Cupriavidus]|uniref:GlcG/HbpS family heme-binding protein n=1 Tax=unclassified Cupriavidus TaxID=2640874 RepID=UPI003F905877